MATEIPNTTFVEDSDTPFEINILYAIFIPLLSFFTIVGNLLILLAFWKVPSLRDKPSELLILNLSCIDLITGSVVLPFWAPVYITPGYWPFGEIGCLLAVIPVNITIHASLYTLLAISVDRLLLVGCEYPQYMKLQSRHRVRITIIGCWIFAMLIWILEAGLWNYAKKLDYTAANIDFSKSCLSPPRRVKTYSLTVFLSLFFTPVMTVVGLSSAFLYFLRRRLKKTKTSGMSQPASSVQPRVPSIADRQAPNSQEPTSSSTQGQASSTNKNRYIKPAVSLLILVFAMAICMLPYCFYVMIIELFCETCNSLIVIYAVFLLQFCNACLDPFLYGLTQRKIRRFYCTCLGNNRVQAT